MQLIGKAKVHGKRTGFCVVLNAEVAVPAKLRLWWTQKQEIPLMVVVECMGAYQQGQKLRRAKIRVGKLHVVGCLHIGQRKDNLFPITRVRHGMHMRLCFCCLLEAFGYASAIL
jgi:hypothetical protein